MKSKNSMYAEVIVGDYYNEEENYWTIDTWKTDETEEEGVVAAKINLKGEVKWEVEEAKNDPLVKRELEQFLDERLFSIKDEDVMLKNIVNILKLMGNSSEETWSIISKDGKAQYDIEKNYILGNYKHCAGFNDCDVFNIEELSSDNDYERFANWILEDIVSGTGEEYVIHLEY